jgi:Leucine-rich repeat (LRR) protein
MVTGGDLNWTATKTFRPTVLQREGISAEEIFLNPKLRNIQTLNLIEFDRSVLVDILVLANLESLILSSTNVVDVSALAQLTNLKLLGLPGAKFLNVSTLAQLKNVEYLDLSSTSVVDVSALAKFTNLKELNLDETRVKNISAEFESGESDQLEPAEFAWDESQEHLCFG